MKLTAAEQDAFFRPLNPGNIVVWNCGGGTDSIGGIIRTVRTGFIPHAILWADTGDEAPLETGLARTEYLDLFDEWLVANGAPRITRVKWIREDGSFLSIADQCERDRSLPSKSYGKAGCTKKWKQQPCDKWVRETFSRGANVERWLGFTAEDDRASSMYASHNAGRPAPQLSLFDVGAPKAPRDAWIWRAPMWEAHMYRSDCVHEIALAGLPPAGKSSCWHCRGMKRAELITLRRVAPQLVDRAVNSIEAQAELRGVKGLGQSWNWGEYLRAYDTGGPLFAQACAGEEGDDEGCLCVDGGDE